MRIDADVRLDVVGIKERQSFPTTDLIRRAGRAKTEAHVNSGNTWSKILPTSCSKLDPEDRFLSSILKSYLFLSSEFRLGRAQGSKNGSNV